MDWYSGALITISGCCVAQHYIARWIDRRSETRLKKISWEIRHLEESGRRIEKMLVSLKKEQSHEEAKQEGSTEEGSGKDLFKDVIREEG